MKDAIQDAWARQEVLTTAVRRAADAVLKEADAYYRKDLTEEVLMENQWSMSTNQVVLARAVLAYRKALAAVEREIGGQFADASKKVEGGSDAHR